ncbi:MAG: hypothetical protein ACI4MS_04155 [Candidatus Coproplasma sp.]
MNALDIVAIVVLCILGVSNVLLWAQTTILFDKLFNHRSEKEKNSTPKNEGNDKI